MTTPRDPDIRLRAYLDDGPSELPIRSYEAVDARIARTRQRAVIGPWRTLRMPNLSRIVSIAAALMLVVLALAIATVGPGGTPTPTAISPSIAPSIVPSPSPSSTPTVYRWPGPLGAGTYDTNLAWDEGLRFHFTVGEGWDAADINIARSNRVGLWFFPIVNVASDICSRSMPQRPAITPEVVLTALRKLVTFDSAPIAATIGGRPAQYVEFTVTSPLRCTADEATLFELPALTCPPGRCSGVGPPFMGAEFGSAPHHERLWLMSVGRRVIAVSAQWTDGATSAELSALQDVIDSFRLDTPLATQAPQPSSP